MCKSNEQGAVAYKVYSTSEDITKNEADEIKKIMEYKPPAQFAYMTKEELEDSQLHSDDQKCPFSFGFFKLESGRFCIALSTYLAQYKIPNKDDRFGNYMIHAFIVHENELEFYPGDIYGGSFLKNDMTVEELSAPYPYEVLPYMDINEVNSFITDEVLIEFIRMRKKQFEMLINAAITAKKKSVSIYINDTSEALVLWMMALHKLVPLRIAKGITFVTYNYNHQKYNTPTNRINMLFVGTKPGVNGFDYRSMRLNTSQIVLDFEEDMNVYSENIPKTEYAGSMAELFVEDIEEIYDFIDFLETTKINLFDERLEKAYELYSFLRETENKNKPDLIGLIRFSADYCEEFVNEKLTEAIVNLNNNVNIDKRLFDEEVLLFVCKYSGYMIIDVFKLLNSYIETNMTEYVEGYCNSLIDQLKRDQNDVYEYYIQYLQNDMDFDKTINGIKRRVGCNGIIAFLSLFVQTIYKDGTGIGIGGNIDILLVETIEQVKNSNNDIWIKNFLTVCNVNLNVIMYVIRRLCQKLDRGNCQLVVTAVMEWVNKADHKIKAAALNMMDDSDEFCDFVLVKNQLKIKNSLDVDKDFWNIYIKYYEKDNTDISLLIHEYLLHVPDIEHIQKIFSKIDMKRYGEGLLSEQINKIIDHSSLKELEELDEFFYQKVFEMSKISELGKAYFLLTAKKLKKGDYQTQSLRDVFAVTNLNISIFNEKEQKYFLNQYFEDYYSVIQKASDTELFIDILCDDANPEIFFSSLSRILKNEREAKRKRIMKDVISLYGPEYKRYIKEDGSERGMLMNGIGKLFKK